MSARALLRRVLAVLAPLTIALTVLAPGIAIAAPSPSPSPSGTGANAKPSDGKKRPTNATFGIAPASTNGIDGRTYIGYRLLGGSAQQDQVAVINHAKAPVTVTLVAADLTNDTGGGVSAALNTAVSKDVGRWITIRHAPKVTIPGATNAGPGQVVIPFTINVPKNATPGDHAGAVLAGIQAVSRGERANLDLTQRVGSRILVRVPGDLHPKLDVQNLTIDYLGTWNPIEAGKARVSYTIKNAGNTILGARQRVSLGGWFGTDKDVPTGTTPDIPFLLPGGTAHVGFEVDVWPSLLRNAKVTAMPMVQEADKNLRVETATASVDFWAIPWVDIVILAGLILLLLGGWLVKRRRRGRGKGDGGGGPKGPKGTPGDAGSPVEPRELEPTTWL
jgi:hypothetical protein